MSTKPPAFLEYADQIATLVALIAIALVLLLPNTSFEIGLVYRGF